MCVDDNHDMADSSADLLGILGYDAQACYDGAAALAMAEDFAPDICLIDLNMPGMDGDEVAVRLRKTGRAVVLVAVTAMGDEAGRQRIIAAGFDLHLVKPVDPRTLPGIINAFERLNSVEAVGN